MLPTSQIRATLAIVLVTAGLAPAASAQTLKLRYGIAAFGEVDPLKSADVLSACGADYIEPALSKTVALAQPALDEALARVAAGRARIETANWFMPGTDIALTGPAVDRERIGRYLDQSLALASRLGVAPRLLKEPDLDVLAGALAEATLYLGSDSGVSHLAAAVGAPALVLFREVNLAWRPWNAGACVVLETASGPVVDAAAALLTGAGRPACGSLGRR